MFDFPERAEFGPREIHKFCLPEKVVKTEYYYWKVLQTEDLSLEYHSSRSEKATATT